MASFTFHSPLDIVLEATDINDSVSEPSEKVTVLPQSGNYVVAKGTPRGWLSIPTLTVVRAGINGATKLSV